MEHTAVAAPSPVKVVNAAALIHGPAHAAALEKGKGIANGIPNPAPATNTEIHPSPKSARTARTTPKGPVAIAESMEELLAMMDGSVDDDIDDSSCNDEENENGTALTLVLFHAHYCKICQRATMQLNRAAREYPPVKFGKVEARVVPEPASENLRNLGISKFPFIQIFRKGDCVASFSTGPTHLFLRKVRDTLDLCLERDGDCWEAFVTDFATEIESNRDARRKFQPELLP
jgi:thiol-disulfide isomerase/thioredoxin